MVSALNKLFLNFRYGILILFFVWSLPAHADFEHLKKVIKESYHPSLAFINCGELVDDQQVQLDTSDLEEVIQKDLLKETQYLSIKNCNLSRLPQNLDILKNLNTLEIKSSHLQSIEGISSLKDNLENLDLPNNEIEEVPEEITQLGKLKILSFSANDNLTRIHPNALRFFRTNLHSIDLKGTPFQYFQSSAPYFSKPEDTAEMQEALDRSKAGEPISEEVLCKKTADLGVLIKTTGSDVEKIASALILDPQSAIYKRSQDGYLPATKMLALKLLHNLRVRQNHSYMEDSSTSIGKALQGQSLEARSKKNIDKLNQLLGKMSEDEENLYETILNTPLYIKHFTDHYDSIRSTAELKSHKTLQVENLIRNDQEQHTNAFDLPIGTSGNVFFRLETSPQVESKSRFGRSAIVMNEDLLNENGSIYFWDFLDSIEGRNKKYELDGKLLRKGKTLVSHTQGIDKVTVKLTHTHYKTREEQDLILPIADTLFFGPDIKKGISKFLVYEARQMGITQKLLTHPQGLQNLLDRLYSIQAMIPNSVKLNPYNHTYIME